LERFIQQSAAQFNASEDAAPDELAADGAAVPPADVDAPLTTAPEDPAPPASSTLAAPTASSRTPDKAVEHDWVDYLTLMLSGASVLLLLFLVTSVLPELRSRLDALTDEQDRQTGTPPTRRAANALPEDRYEDEDENS
jgi:hypothetical protein